MLEKNEIVEIQKNELLDIFIEEKDRNGTDLLEMSNFFDMLIGKIDMRVDSKTVWENHLDIEGLSGQIAAAIKCGYDISKMGILVADDSGFETKHREGIKRKIYHIGKSSEVAGNLRPAILDEKGQLVKFFTLKKALNPSEILSDICTLSMQLSLKQMSAQIEDVGRDVKGLIDFERRIALGSNFINARGKIKRASNANLEKQGELLDAADTYLMEGLTNLNMDVDAQIKKLMKQQGVFASVKSIDNILSYINEDMQMILRYLGLRMYLLNIRGKFDDVDDVLGEYQYKLRILAEGRQGKGKYTALELIHENYPYNRENVDFWLKEPKQILNIIDSYKTMRYQKECFFIDVEESNNEG